MGKLILPGDRKTYFKGETGEVSDGYHTFNELYAHRCILYAALVSKHMGISWKSRKDSEGKAYDGYFVAGMRLPTGLITYQVPDNLWERFNVEELDKGEYDGHSGEDVLKRLAVWSVEEGKGEGEGEDSAS